MNLLRRRFKIAHLIAEEFAGVITKENQARLEQWRVESPAHAKEYDEIRTYIMTGNEYWEKEKRTVKNEWRKFERVHFGKYVIWKKIGRCAAIMVIPLLVCGYFVSSEWKFSEVTIADHVEIVPGTGRAQLIMADGRFLKLEQKENMKLDLPGVKIVATEKKIVYRAIEEETSTPKEEEYNTLVVPRGGEYMLELSDGTKVWLNSDSELRFPITFVGDRRSVEIEGEAYFEVAKDAKKPFTVQFMSSSVTVLGTSFNIRAYPEEKRSQTTLAEGSVRIYSPGSSMLLKPGEQAEVSALSGEMVKQEVEVKNFTSWKDGRFVFEQQPLEDIMRTLERWYDIRVIFKDEGAKRISLSGNMKRYGDFSQVMKMLQMTGDVRFELHGNDVYITTE